MNYNKNQAETDSLCQSLVYKPRILRLTTASNALAVGLNAGRYRMTADVDCFVAQGPAGALTCSNAADSPLWGGTYDYIVSTGSTDNNVAAATTAGTGYLYLTQQAGER